MVLPRNKPKTKWYRTVKNKCLKKKKNRTEIYRANTERAKIKKFHFRLHKIQGIARNRELHSAMKYHLLCRCKSSMGPWQTSNLLDVQWKAPTDHWGPFERMVHCGVTEGDRQNNSRSQGLRKAWTPVRCVIKPPLIVRNEIAEWRQGDQHWSGSCTNQMFHSPYCGLNIYPKSS